MSERARAIIPTFGIATAMVLFYLAPITASAAQVSVQTQQLLPPGLNVCQPVDAPTYKEYVYDGQLNSFDVFLHDPSYVAVAGAVGEQPIPFFFMTRSVDEHGTLRIHVDTPSIPVDDADPLIVTLVSSLPGHPTCLTSVAILHQEGSAVTAGTTASNGTSFGSTNQTQKPAVSKAAPKSKKVTVAPKKQVQVSANKDGQAPAGEVAVANSPERGTLDRICTMSHGGAARLWTILLAVYFLVIAATILALPEGKPSTQSSVLLGVAIGIPLLVLLSIWKVAPECHVGAWAPIAALLIGAAGLVLGFRHHPTFASLFGDGK